MTRSDKAGGPNAGYDPLDDEPRYPFQRLVGFRIAEWNEGAATVVLDLGEQHMNRHGLPHGGVYSVLIDTASGYAGSWSGDPGKKRRAMTLSMTVDYLGVATGDQLIAKARVRGGGRNVFFTEAEVRDESGTLCATGTGVFRYRKGEQSA